MSKLVNLQDTINNINEEIEMAEEIIKVKKIQNNDLKTVVDRLESSFGVNNSDDMFNDDNTKKCLCSNSCIII